MSTALFRMPVDIRSSPLSWEASHIDDNFTIFTANTSLYAHNTSKPMPQAG